MTTRFYNIMFRSAKSDGAWMPINETEYTKEEADRELRMLKSTAEKYGTPYVFRKLFIYSAETEILSVRRA